jgi:hypothetical protein
MPTVVSDEQLRGSVTLADAHESSLPLARAEPT